MIMEDECQGRSLRYLSGFRGMGRLNQSGHDYNNAVLRQCHSLIRLGEAIGLYNNLDARLRTCTVGKARCAREVCAGGKLPTLKLSALSIRKFDRSLRKIFGR